MTAGAVAGGRFCSPRSWPWAGSAPHRPLVARRRPCSRSCVAAVVHLRASVSSGRRWSWGALGRLKGERGDRRAAANSAFPWSLPGEDDTGSYQRAETPRGGGVGTKGHLVFVVCAASCSSDSLCSVQATPATRWSQTRAASPPLPRSSPPLSPPPLVSDPYHPHLTSPLLLLLPHNLGLCSCPLLPRPSPALLSLLPPPLPLPSSFPPTSSLLLLLLLSPPSGLT